MSVRLRIGNVSAGGRSSSVHRRSWIRRRQRVSHLEALLRAVGRIVRGLLAVSPDPRPRGVAPARAQRLDLLDQVGDDFTLLQVIVALGPVARLHLVHVVQAF